MIRFLPFIIIAVLILGGLGYWRYSSSKATLTTPSTQQDTPIEVPKSLPQATLEDRVKTLEDLITKLVSQINNLKSSSPQSASSVDTRLSAVEAAVSELKVRVSSLEKATPTVSSTQSTVYIPLGGGGGPWGNKDWYSLSEYQISLDPANYPSYTGMSLEVNFRLTGRSGTGSVRLYNSTDNTVTSPQVDTTSDGYGVSSSSSFKLPTGNKTYKLQIKSSEGQDLLIQSARIKVNF